MRLTEAYDLDSSQKWARINPKIVLGEFNTVKIVSCISRSVLGSYEERQWHPRTYLEIKETIFNVKYMHAFLGVCMREIFVQKVFHVITPLL